MWLKTQYLKKKIFLWPNIRSILNNVPYEFEDNVYYATFRWNVLYISFNTILYSILFTASVTDLPSGWSVHLCKWDITLLLSLSYCQFLLLIYIFVFVLWVYVLLFILRASTYFRKLLYLLLWFKSWSLYNVLLCLQLQSLFQTLFFSDGTISMPVFLSFSLARNTFFHPSFLVCMCL